MGSECHVDVPISQRQPRTGILLRRVEYQRSGEVGSRISGGNLYRASAYWKSRCISIAFRLKAILISAAGRLEAGNEVHDIGRRINHRRTQNTKPRGPDNILIVLHVLKNDRRTKVLRPIHGAVVGIDGIDGIQHAALQRQRYASPRQWPGWRHRAVVRISPRLYVP